MQNDVRFSQQYEICRIVIGVRLMHVELSSPLQRQEDSEGSTLI